ncbi:hypothetical protein ATC03_00200 [Agromyces aureus]|uniref:Tyr recombinase domain-containing protein n=2 Tax=Agromyces aureus TaxID=453304 RepID=A0A191WAZ3_9MICO|nr:hypothetical protein ATC03_00200 [Agromyces aureus]
MPYREVDLLRVMEKFAFWCVQHELLLENRTVFTEAVIADFVRDGVRGLKDASRANMRAQLRRMAEVLNGPAPQAEKLAPADPQRPYLKDEISSLRSWATSQKVHHRRDARLILALGFGAGLSAAEIGEIRESDVTADQGGVTVRVRAGRIRSVPVRRVWAARLEEVAGSSSDEYLVRPGRTSTPKNFISNIVARGKLSTGGPNTQRMRATWLLHHMNQGTPLLALLEASGLDSLEALTRYVRFLNPIDLAVSQEMLRN